MRSSAIMTWMLGSLANTGFPTVSVDLTLSTTGVAQSAAVVWLLFGAVDPVPSNIKVVHATTVT